MLRSNVIVAALWCLVALLATPTHALDDDSPPAPPPSSPHQHRYTADWKSLDSRPLPPWYDDAKLGIFVHWGVFSVPGFVSEWFWYYWATGRADVVQFMQRNYPPNFRYADFAPQFTAEFYEPDRWADMFAASGAGYVVFTTKHHEGFCNWPTKVSFNWNSMEVGPNRDLVGELATSIRKRTSMKFGVYHSLFEWYNPMFEADRKNGFKTRDYVERKSLPELRELVETYKPDLVWSDGDPAPVSYWNSTGFLAWLYNDSPVKDTVVTNDRWGTGTGCKHGGYFTCYDRYQPGKKLNRKWENCMTIDKTSWGYRRNSNLADFLSTQQIISTLVETVSCGGNMLMNVGPTSDGRIVPVFEERLRELGAWLKVNGDAIYKTAPWTHQNDTITKNVWYTAARPGTLPTSPSVVYAIALFWPEDNTLHLGALASHASNKMEISMLGVSGNLQWTEAEPSLGGGVLIKIPSLPGESLPCKHSWAFKISIPSKDIQDSDKGEL